MLPEFKDQFYTEEYKTLIRSNKEYLISMASLIPINDLSFVKAHQYDFYKVIWETLNVPHHAHWTTAFINDITDPNQYIGDMREVLIIDTAVLNKMLQRVNMER